MDNGVEKITLTAFFGARIEELQNENGKVEKCVCIPIERNGLCIGRSGKVNAYAFVNKTKNADRGEWTHYLKMKMPLSLVRKYNDLGYNIPYLGNIKPKNYIIHKNAYNEAKNKGYVNKKDYE